MKTIATASHFFIVLFLEPVQDLFCAVCQHHKSSGKNSGILYHQTSRPGQQRKTMLPLPKSGTHTSGVVTRNESVPTVIMTASAAPASPI